MLKQPSDSYIVEYPQAVAFAEEQEKILWFPKEINVEKDVQDIRVHLSESERHGVITVLKLFTKYELIVGDDYWQQMTSRFKKPACVSRAASLFQYVEKGIHAPFYSNINTALGLGTEEFYSEYTNDSLLADRISYLEEMSKGSDEDFLTVLSLTEGAILYSSFAFLKHFQSQGKNKIPNIVAGINFSVRDESLHSLTSSWLYNTLIDEGGTRNEARVYEIAEVVRAHEHAIVDKIFEKGAIENITDVQMKNFVDSRIDLVLRNLGYKPVYNPSHNPVADWFYKSINDYVANDFFTRTGREYTRGRNVEEFIK